MKENNEANSKNSNLKSYYKDIDGFNKATKIGILKELNKRGLLSDTELSALISKLQ